MIIGGPAMSLALTREAIARGIDVFSGYGMSETCPIMTLAQPGPGSDEENLVQRTRTGKPIALIELAVVDAQMKLLPHDGVSAGELSVRAPWLTQAYVKKPVESEQLWASGRLHTGDIGMIGADGMVRITDRVQFVDALDRTSVGKIDKKALRTRYLPSG